MTRSLAELKELRRIQGLRVCNASRGKREREMDLYGDLDLLVRLEELRLADETHPDGAATPTAPHRSFIGDVSRDELEALEAAGEMPPTASQPTSSADPCLPGGVDSLPF